MSEQYRQRRISECIRKYEPTPSPLGGYFVRDAETKEGCGGTYETKTMADTQCRMLAAADIERLYIPDEAAALARVAAIIGEQSDPQWAARMIVDYFAGSKA